MKQETIFIGITILLALIFNSCARQSDFPVLKGPYLGQKSPGNTPELFAPGIVSTRHYENSITISPDGTQLFFSSYRPVEANAPPKKDWDIWVVDRTEHGWSQPHNLGPTINTVDRESSPSVTMDGTLYFKRSGSGLSNIYRSNENCPFVSSDGRYLFFNSYKKGKQEPYWEHPLSYDEVLQKLNDIHKGFPNIYWVDAQIIEDFTPHE
jgi:Tol biopolymer transport system component